MSKNYLYCTKWKRRLQKWRIKIYILEKCTSIYYIYIYILLQIITIFFYNLNNNYTQFKSFLFISWIYGIHEKLKIIYLPQLSLSPSHLHTYSSVSLSLSHHQHSFLLQIYCLYIFSSLIKDRAISIHFFFILSIIKVTQQINLNKYIFF